jgi:hypothetical protein
LPAIAFYHLSEPSPILTNSVLYNVHIFHLRFG